MSETLNYRSLKPSPNQPGPAQTRALWMAEARALLKLSAPLVITQLAQMAVLTTDIIMLSRYSEVALAAAGLGHTIFFLCWLIGTGPGAAVAPMVAQIVGGRPMDRANVRGVVRMGLWSVVIMGLPLILILLCTEQILVSLGQKPELAAAAGQFLTPLCFGLPFALAFQVLRNFSTALNRPNASLVVMLLTVLINAAGQYMLIFGHFGAPRMGITGSGIASALSYAFSFFAMLGVIFLTPTLRDYRILRRIHRFDRAKFAELLRLGIPIGLTMIFEAALFNSSMLIMGMFGTAYVAAHQIALNVPSVTFMVPLGVAMAATVRVGLAVGANDPAGVRRAGYTSLAMSTAFMTICSLVLALFPRQIAELYFPPHAGNIQTIALVVSFLYFAAAFQIMDGLQVVAALALRGMKDARAPMWIAGVCYWLIGFPTCFILGFMLDMKGIGVWIGCTVALFCAAIAMCWRFYYLTHKR